MNRFLVDATLSPGTTVDLGERNSHHALRVLRLRDGEPIEVFDGRGLRAQATLIHQGRANAAARIGATEAGTSDSPLELTLAQCVSSPDRMDWTIEKAVELGVAAIVPLLSERGIVRLDEDRARKRHARWQEIVVAACMQCGRDRLPRLVPATPLRAWLSSRDAGAEGLALLLSPRGEHVLRTLSFPAPPARATLLVGPEAGLSPDEEAAAQRAGFVAVRFGPRVLRTETAGPAVLAALGALHGDL